MGEFDPFLEDDDPSYERLRKEGSVVIFRTSKMKETSFDRHTLGDASVYSVSVQFLTTLMVNPANLMQYVDRSGYDRVVDWLSDIHERAGKTVPWGYLYEVTLVNEGDSR